MTTASHTDSQRQDDQQKVGKTPALVTLGTSPKQDDFDWSGEDVIIHEQPATAVYFNPQGALVIRQKASDYDYGDPFVYIGPDHIEAFLAVRPFFGPPAVRFFRLDHNDGPEAPL
jgi:hypothetical protein